MRFAIFPVHISKVLRLLRESEARSYEVLHLSGKIILANLTIWCSKMQPLSGNPPWSPNTSNSCVSCTAPATRNASFQILFKCPTPAIVFGNATKPSRFARCTIPCAYHLNVQKCSEPVSFLHFWLGNVLRATAVCTFSTLQLLKVLRSWSVLYILTSKCASRHNGVHFFDITASKVVRTWCVFSSFIWPAGWLRTCRFSEPTFRHKSLAKHCVSRLSYHLDLLSSSLLFSDSSHLCFSSVHIVGSLTSKLPSTIR